VSRVAHRISIPILALFALVLIAYPLRSTAVSAAPSGRHCKTVIKHGKKHRVCSRGAKPGTPTPTPTATPTPTLPPPDYAAQAQTLVNGYHAAATDDARLQVLEAIMAALHVTVYGPDAKPVVQGAGGPTDPAFVELELQQMAAHLQAGDTTDLADLAHDLALLGVDTSNGGPASADAFAAGLEAAVAQAMAHQQSLVSLPLLLVRELGLRHSPSVDLAQSVPASQIRLDPLQRYLVSASLLIPWAQGSSTVRDRLRPAQTEAGWAFGGGTYGPSPLVTALGQLLPAGPPKLSDVAGWFTAQFLKTSFFDIHPEIEQPLRTAYGPPGQPDDTEGLGGKALTFKLYADIPSGGFGHVDTCVKEFALLGSSAICNTYNLSGLDVNWKYSEIQPYGVLAPDPNGVIVGSYAPVVSGYATIVFTPNNDPLPGIGAKKTVMGAMTTSPQLAKRLGITDPKLAALIDGQYAGQQFPWSVLYHKPRGFKFDGLHWHVTDNLGVGYPDSTSDYTISGRICGADPKGLWQLTIQEDDNWPVFGHFQFHGSYQVDWVPGNRFPIHGNLGQQEMDTSVILSGPDPRVGAIIRTKDGMATPALQGVHASISEDTACPDD
jgi:hypothetical protein